jgi:hypothetical protein
MQGKNWTADGPEIKSIAVAGCQWLVPVIIATWEAEIRRITVQGQSWKTVCETTISKITRGKRMEEWLKHYGACFVSAKL